MRSAILVWTKISQSTIPANVLKHIQKAWDSPVTASVYQNVLVDPHNTSINVARLRAVALEHAAPITAVGLRLSDEAIRVAVGPRLGSTTCQPHTCICDVAVDAEGLHGLSCRKSSARQIRRAQLNDIVWRAVRKAQYPAVKEPFGLSRFDGKRPDGATLISWTRASQWRGTALSLTPTPTRTSLTHRQQHRRRQSNPQKTRQRSTKIGKDPPICANSN